MSLNRKTFSKIDEQIHAGNAERTEFPLVVYRYFSDNSRIHDTYMMYDIFMHVDFDPLNSAIISIISRIDVNYLFLPSGVYKRITYRTTFHIFTRRTIEIY